MVFHRLKKISVDEKKPVAAVGLGSLRNQRARDDGVHRPFGNLFWSQDSEGGIAEGRSLQVGKPLDQPVPSGRVISLKSDEDW